MIELFLNYGEQTNPGQELPVFYGQKWCNKIMLFIIVVTPPWMLFTKPYLIISEHNKILQEK